MKQTARYYLDMTVSVGWILRILEDGEAIAAVQILRQHEDGPIDAEQKNTALLLEAKRQLDEYFAGERTEFQLPLNPKGTEFQNKVWHQLLQIPYGETRTYGQIAEAVGNPKASRAVGGANHNNPIAVIIPCHRVIGADGKLTGYAGGVDLKETLLRLERVIL